MRGQRGRGGLQSWCQPCHPARCTVLGEPANVSGPDGDELANCRVTVPEDASICVDAFDGVLYLGSFENVTPATTPATSSTSPQAS